MSPGHRVEGGLVRTSILMIVMLCGLAQAQESCLQRLTSITDALGAYHSSHSERYPDQLSPTSALCPLSEKPYEYTVSADLRWYGLYCGGNHHKHYPAASATAGIKHASTGTTYSQCRDNVRRLVALSESYRKRYGSYPAALAYLVDEGSVHLPSCDPGSGLRAPNETDYRIMQTSPDSFHIFCTSVNHISEGYAPLQPSYINGLPAKAMFLIRD